MRFLLIFLAVGVSAARGDFFDDFESYQPGEDPGDSFHWTREPAGGNVLVTAQGDEQVIEAVFPDSAYLAYICNTAGFWADGTVSMDFRLDGSGSFANVYSRMQLATGEAYVGGIFMFFQPYTYSYIGYVSVTGEYELLYYDFGPILSPDDWVNVGLEIQGEDPVILTLYTNGEETAQVSDPQFLLEPGLSGFALLYEEELPQIFADNFLVVISPQALRATTFGAVKRAFQ